MTIGPSLTLWSARVAFLLYAAALLAWLKNKPRAAAIAWTTGLLVYLGHVAAAFQFYHHWSHRAAYDHTARQTMEMFGIHSGFGLYWNYVFTAVWATDVVWMWMRPERYRRRSRWITVTVHVFLAFLFFNATIVFGSSWARALGAILVTAIVCQWLRNRSHID
jgi:hypothetical protein